MAPTLGVKKQKEDSSKESYVSVMKAIPAITQTNMMIPQPNYFACCGSIYGKSAAILYCNATGDVPKLSVWWKRTFTTKLVSLMCIVWMLLFYIFLKIRESQLDYVIFQKVSNVLATRSVFFFLCGLNLFPFGKKLK